MVQCHLCIYDQYILTLNLIAFVFTILGASMHHLKCQSCGQIEVEQPVTVTNNESAIKVALNCQAWARIAKTRESTRF